jgi:hypothetical protein
VKRLTGTLPSAAEKDFLKKTKTKKKNNLFRRTYNLQGCARELFYRQLFYLCIWWLPTRRIDSAWLLEFSTLAIFGNDAAFLKGL